MEAKSPVTRHITTGLIMIFSLSFVSLNGRASGSESVPRFLVEPESAVVRTGSTLVLNCSVEPDAANVRWILNGSLLTSLKRRGYDVRDGNLRISSFNSPDSLSHDGSYQCVASNALGTVVSKEAKVEAAVMGSYQAAETETSVVALAGNVALVPCSVPYSKPRATIEFLLNNTRLLPSARHMVLPSGHLQIANVSHGDCGLYQCTVVNAVIGSRLTSPASYRLKVNVPKSDVPPTFILTSEDLIIAHQGSNLTLECAAEGWPIPRVTWEKYGGHLPVGRFSQVLGNLVIGRIQKFDAGTYVCRVNNTNGLSQTKVISVDVLEPPTIETAPSDQSSTEGSTVVFKCRPHGSQKLTIQWLYNGNPVVNGQFVTLRDTSLTLSNIHRRQSGIYQCVVRNGLGMVHAAARLSVMDPSKTVLVTSPAAGGWSAVLENEGYDNYDGDEEEEEEDDDEEEEEDDDYGTFGGSPGTRPNEKSNKNHRLDGSVPQDRLESRNSGKPGNEAQLLAPSKPTITILTNTSVLVQWTMTTPPATPPGGPTVAIFKIQFKELHGDSTSLPPSKWQTLDDDISYALRMFEVPRLRSGRTYRFRVSVVYSNDDSRHGPVSQRVTLTGGQSSRGSPMPPPVIVEARTLSVSQISIGWKQQDADWPVEGFTIYYKPYSESSTGSHQVPPQTLDIPGPTGRRAVLSGLLAGTSYSIQVQSYGGGIESALSNTVVKNTLSSTADSSPVVLQPPPQQQRPSGRNQKPIAPDLEETATRWPGQMQDQSQGGAGADRNKLTYIVVGIVFGVIVIVAASCASVCFWKRNKKQRFLNENKHPDQTTAFLNGRKSSKVDASHVPGCTGECSLSKAQRNNVVAPGAQPRKFGPDLNLPPPPSVLPPGYSFQNGSTQVSIYNSVNFDDDDNQRTSKSPIYTKVSSLDNSSFSNTSYNHLPLNSLSPGMTAGAHHGAVGNPQQQGKCGNPGRPSFENIPKAPDHHNPYWVLEQATTTDNLPERLRECQAPPNSSLFQPIKNRTADGATRLSRDNDSDRYDLPMEENNFHAVGQGHNVIQPGSSSSSSAFHEGPMEPSSRHPLPPPLFSVAVGNSKRPIDDRQPERKPNNVVGTKTNDSWKNLTNQVVGGQYNIHGPLPPSAAASGSGKASAGNTFPLPRVNDYPPSDMEDYR